MNDLLVDPADFLGNLVGMRPWRVWNGHGSALFFEFGEEREDNPRFGRWGLSLEGCVWQIWEHGVVLVDSNTADIDGGAHLLEGVECTVARTFGRLLDLRLHFEDRFVLVTAAGNERMEAWTVTGPAGSATVTDGGIPAWEPSGRKDSPDLRPLPRPVGDPDAFFAERGIRLKVRPLERGHVVDLVPYEDYFRGFAVGDSAYAAKQAAVQRWKGDDEAPE